LLAVVAATAAFAEHGGSIEDQLACTPDVYRLCSSQIPNEDAIVACLNRNKTSLSQGCKRVFSRADPGQGDSQPGDDSSD
jgi:hypothetical protein